MPDVAVTAANVRRLAKLTKDEGPDDAHIHAAVLAFAERMEYWYVRVMREAVPKYRNLIIKRINPFVRRIEFEGLSAKEVATRLVEDYSRRNFVTAGGWALEAMARAGAIDVQKSGAAGIDLQRHDPASGDYHLYVLKSGLVTRNSDIVNALKAASRKAEKLLKQDRSTGTVHANYVVLAGKTTPSFEDGVNRPASAQFWAEMFKLPEDKAVELALAMAAEAGRVARYDASVAIQELLTVVTTYISRPDEPSSVDWDFLARRNMGPKASWKADDAARHKKSLENLKQARNAGAIAPSEATIPELAK